ncbi:MAG: cytochrome ubiquinol oxidase subunit I [Actinomycetota bacterium]
MSLALAAVARHGSALDARGLQGLSFAAHIPLVCMAIGFPAMVVFAEWLGLRAGDELYLRLARRWTRVMAALFAVGVVTGTILSFELGMVWPEFMSRFSSVFGLGFAIEGFSFFTEAIFIGVYVYGWDRLSPRLHLLSGLPIVAAGAVGSFMVISVNAWMNHPSGFALDHGKAVDVHPVRALFANTYVWHEFVHMYVAGYIVTGFLVASAYAFGALRGRFGRYERTALAIPLTVAALASPVQVLVGDWAGRDVASAQPLKLAAMDALPHTERGAPEHILGWWTGHDTAYSLAIPHALSLLADHSLDARVEGLDAVPPADRPPVNVVHWAFQAMVGIGTALALLGLGYLWVRFRTRSLPRSRWFYRAVVLAGPASVAAVLAGWITTEVGRQPWTVYRVLRTPAAATTGGWVPYGLVVLAAIYLALGLAVVWLLRHLAGAPLGGRRELSDAVPPEVRRAVG